MLRTFLIPNVISSYPSNVVDLDVFSGILHLHNCIKRFLSQCNGKCIMAENIWVLFKYFKLSQYMLDPCFTGSIQILLDAPFSLWTLVYSKGFCAITPVCPFRPSVSQSVHYCGCLVVACPLVRPSVSQSIHPLVHPAVH